MAAESRHQPVAGDFALAHQDGAIGKARTSLAKFDLLILDDFGPAPMTERGKYNACTRSSSMLLAGQLPFKGWHACIDNPMVADAILDRIVGVARRSLYGQGQRPLPDH